MVERKKQMLKSKQKVRTIIKASRKINFYFFSISVSEDADGRGFLVFTLILSFKYCLGKRKSTLEIGGSVSLR